MMTYAEIEAMLNRLLRHADTLERASWSFGDLGRPGEAAATKVHAADLRATAAIARASLREETEG